MRRHAGIAAILGIALVATSAAAQDTRLIGKGFKLGMGMYSCWGGDAEMDLSANLQDAAPDAPGVRPGLVFGGFLTVGLGPNVAIQPEILYVQKGTKYTIEYFESSIASRVDADITFKLDYIDVPILVKYMIPMEGGTRPSMFFGPALALNVSSRMKVEANAPGYGSQDVEVDLEDGGLATKDLDVGAVIGGGMDFAAGRGTISADVRYTLGLTVWPDVPDAAINAQDSIKNGGWMVTVGYGF